MIIGSRLSFTRRARLNRLTASDNCQGKSRPLQKAVMRSVVTPDFSAIRLCPSQKGARRMAAPAQV
ncbi:MAG: hypothetical protein JJT81_10195 [Rubellimicrobium sp.]|nr:hypothetical protein [Rubellimicrobium sp.]